MPELIRPSSDVQTSFLAAMDEFRAEGRGGPDDNSMIGHEMQDYGARWTDPAVFEEYVRWLRDQSLEDSPRAAGWVPSTTLWWVNGQDYLGRVAIRHRLTPGLLKVGGHIGYDVRPSARRRGHATALLSAALPWAAKLGIDPALITCDEDNTGSRKVIESNGGRLEDQRGITMRYWVPTSRSGRPSTSPADHTSSGMGGD
jgi:predicted acetyltransferase